MTATDLDAFRGMNYDIAEAIAPTWESRRADIESVATPLRAWLVRELAPRAGETILELAAGTGDTGFDVAEALGEDGTLISSDFSPAMLAATRRRGAERGIANVEYRLIDAERIDLEEDSVDGVVCRFAYMLMADPAAALLETRRVLRPGGRLVLGVWGPAERNPYFTTIVAALVEGGHMPPPDPSGPGIFSMGSEERTRALLEGAGFTETRTELLTSQFEIPDVDEYLASIADTAGPIAFVVRGLSAADRDAVRTYTSSALERFADENGYRIPCAALAAVAS